MHNFEYTVFIKIIFLISLKKVIIFILEYTVVLQIKLLNLYLLKLSYKNWWVKFDEFSRKNGSFIFLPKGSSQRQKWIILSHNKNSSIIKHKHFKYTFCVENKNDQRFCCSSSFLNVLKCLNIAVFSVFCCK